MANIDMAFVDPRRDLDIGVFACQILARITIVERPAKEKPGPRRDVRPSNQREMVAYRSTALLPAAPKAAG